MCVQQPSDAGAQHVPLRDFQAAAVVCQHRDWRVSNLVLQKILFVAEVFYLKEKGDSDFPLIREEYFAWDLGPVLPDLYQRVKVFGASAIRPSERLNWEMIPAEEAWRDMCAHLRDVSDFLEREGLGAYRLVSLTHEAGGAWEKAREGLWFYEKGERAISKADMLTHDAANLSFYNKT